MNKFNVGDIVLYRENTEEDHLKYYNISASGMIPTYMSAGNAHAVSGNYTPTPVSGAFTTGNTQMNIYSGIMMNNISTWPKPNQVIAKITLILDWSDPTYEIEDLSNRNTGIMIALEEELTKLPELFDVYDY